MSFKKIFFLVMYDFFTYLLKWFLKIIVETAPPVNVLNGANCVFERLRLYIDNKSLLFKIVFILRICFFLTILR